MVGKANCDRLMKQNMETRLRQWMSFLEEIHHPCIESAHPTSCLHFFSLPSIPVSNDSNLRPFKQFEEIKKCCYCQARYRIFGTMMKDNEVYICIMNQAAPPFSSPVFQPLGPYSGTSGFSCKNKASWIYVRNLQTNKKSTSESWRHDNGPPNGLTVLIYEKEKSKENKKRRVISVFKHPGPCLPNIFGGLHHLHNGSLGNHSPHASAVLLGHQ